MLDLSATPSALIDRGAGKPRPGDAPQSEVPAIEEGIWYFPYNWDPAAPVEAPLAEG